MVQIKVSERQAKDLRKISEAGVEPLKRFLEWLETSPAILQGAKLKDKFKELYGDQDTSRAAYMQVLGLASFRRRRSYDVSEVVGGLIEGVRRTDDSDQISQWLDKNRAIFERILDSKSIRLATKAMELCNDYDFLVSSTLVITDIRPVYSSDKTSIDGGVISNILRITYFDSGDERTKRSISYTLDVSDIDSLIGQLEAAKQKISTAEKFLSQDNSLPYFLPNGE